MIRSQMILVVMAALCGSACASVSRTAMPSHAASLDERRAAYEALRHEDDDHAVAGDSERLLDVVAPDSLTAVEAREAARARENASMFFIAGTTTIATSWTAGLIGAGTSVILATSGVSHDYALGITVGVASAGLALAGSAVGTALLVPGALSWAEAVDHDVAAFSTYDADLRARLNLVESAPSTRLAANPLP